MSSEQDLVFRLERIYASVGASKEADTPTP